MPLSSLSSGSGCGKLDLKTPSPTFFKVQKEILAKTMIKDGLISRRSEPLEIHSVRQKVANNIPFEAAESPVALLQLCKTRASV